MALHTKTGLTGLSFGVPNLDGFIVQSYTESKHCANVIEVLDETGNRVCARYDDETTELTFDAIFTSTSEIPEAGELFEYNGIKYEVLSYELKGENKGAKKVSIKGKVSQYITLT